MKSFINKYSFTEWQEITQKLGFGTLQEITEYPVNQPKAKSYPTGMIEKWAQPFLMIFANPKTNKTTYVLANNHGIITVSNDMITGINITPSSEIIISNEENNKLRKSSLTLVKELSKHATPKELEEMYYYRLEQMDNLTNKLNRLGSIESKYKHGLDKKKKIKLTQSEEHPRSTFFIKKKIEHINDLYTRLDNYRDYVYDCANQIEHFYTKQQMK